MRKVRPQILFAVLGLHAGLIFLAMFLAQKMPIKRLVAEAHIFLLVPQQIQGAINSSKLTIPMERPFYPPLDARPPALLRTPDNSITAPSVQKPAPNIDWEQAAQTAANNAMANAEQQHNYRDLSSLSAEQLAWARKNHMEPMPPDFHWHHHRVEFNSKTGLPVIWINDYCVLITVIPFCQWGKKIQPDGTLFEHMRDPHDP